MTAATIADAEAALDRLDTLARRVADVPDAEPEAESIEAFRTFMDNDLNTPGVYALVFGLVTEINRRLDAGESDSAAPQVAAWRAILDAVGLVPDASVDDVPEQVAALAVQRDEARASKDWATADALRDQIASLGFLAEDSAAGTVVRRA